MKIILLSIGCIWLIFVAYMIHQQNIKIKDYRFEIAHLTNQVFWLRSIDEIGIEVWEQVLTPLQMAELKAMNAKLIQDKQRAYEGREMPILTEEERG